MSVDNAADSMDEVVEINIGLDDACRLCLTTEEARSSIFSLTDASVSFAEKIRSCLSIQVTSNDKLSTLVCESCIKSINHWHSYKSTCLKAQEKLQQWFVKKNSTFPVIRIKEEPIDAEYQDSSAQAVLSEDNTNNHVAIDKNRINITTDKTEAAVTSNLARTLPEKTSGDKEIIAENYLQDVQIKTEPMDTDDEDDCNIDIESVNSGELLINPMAVAVAKTVNKERRMEADTTQKFRVQRFVGRKKFRRGAHTHFRGLRLFKKKCPNCKINLHSKHSYNQHMSKYHGIVNNLDMNVSDKPIEPPVSKQKSTLAHRVDNVESIVDTQNEISSEDAEFEKMIEDDPLTTVQKTIISQLKTFSCYTCKQTFFDRRHTLNHIRQHMPDLKPFTCIACLTEFSDRSMYKLHCGASFKCAMKIALVVPQVGHEKYFTCNMCLKTFNNRQELLSHLALHSDKHKSSTSSIRAPSKLSSTTPGSRADLTPSKRIGNPAGPYMNGDPAHNHMCDLCGMIYRYRPNMVKHRDLCSTLAENVRTSYRCIHCSMTYLVYKKFYTHVYYEHKKREITCFTCHAKFPTADEYLVHHETHRVYSKQSDQASEIRYDQQQMTTAAEKNSIDPLNTSNHPSDANEKFNCALCSENFDTKHELDEHRNLHLKVKIYSCVICRSMFSSSSALELHMKEHGIEDAAEQAGNSSCVEYGGSNSLLNESSQSATSDPGGSYNHCYECNKTFANLANLKRHERNLHYGRQRRWHCTHCKRRFKSREAHDEHIEAEHNPEQQDLQNADEIMSSPLEPRYSSTTGKPLMQCPKCPRTFTYQGNLIQHCQNVHKENHFERVVRHVAPPPPRPPPPPPRPQSHACDICGKAFREEQSLKTHRGWHLRSNHRLKADQNISLDETLLSGPGFTMTMTTSPANPVKPAKARKSFPNNPSQKQLSTIGNLQCQVCDDRFNDVAELRNHLWDVHCARNKPEKSFASELQCELCTTKFPDEDSLRNHMKWHSQNPIFGSNSGANNASAPIVNQIQVSKKSFHCDVCGKYYSNRKMYIRHKKLHKVSRVATMINLQSLQGTKRHYCHACQKNFSTDASLKRHKISPCHLSVVRSQMQAPAKKITTTAIVHQPPPEFINVQSIKKEPGMDYLTQQSPSNQAQYTKKKPVTCSDCYTIFPNMSVLYQHKQLVHKMSPGLGSPISREKSYSSQQQQQQQPQEPKECVPLVNPNGLVSCNVCDRQFPGLANLKIHFTHKHKHKSTAFPCRAPGCKLAFSSYSSLKNHLNTHTNMIYNCNLCDRHVFSKTAMIKHMLAMHKAIYQSGTNKASLWSETDLTRYHIKNCQSTACPKCKVKYPNWRALKIHYLKFHEKT